MSSSASIARTNFLSICIRIPNARPVSELDGSFFRWWEWQIWTGLVFKYLVSGLVNWAGFLLLSHVICLKLFLYERQNSFTRFVYRCFSDSLLGFCNVDRHPVVGCVLVLLLVSVFLVSLIPTCCLATGSFWGQCGGALERVLLVKGFVVHLTRFGLIPVWFGIYGNYRLKPS